MNNPDQTQGHHIDRSNGFTHHPADDCDLQNNPSHSQDALINPSQGQSLDDIVKAQLGYAYYNGLDRRGYSVAEEERAQQNIRIAVRELVEGIIGEDEWDESNIRDTPLVDVVMRNELRAEQRATLLVALHIKEEKS